MDHGQDDADRVWFQYTYCAYRVTTRLVGPICIYLLYCCTVDSKRSPRGFGSAETTRYGVRYKYGYVCVSVLIDGYVAVPLCLFVGHQQLINPSHTTDTTRAGLKRMYAAGYKYRPTHHGSFSWKSLSLDPLALICPGSSSAYCLFGLLCAPIVEGYKL